MSYSHQTTSNVLGESDIKHLNLLPYEVLSKIFKLCDIKSKTSLLQIYNQTNNGFWKELIGSTIFSSISINYTYYKQKECPIDLRNQLVFGIEDLVELKEVAKFVESVDFDIENIGFCEFEDEDFKKRSIELENAVKKINIIVNDMSKLKRAKIPGYPDIKINNPLRELRIVYNSTSFKTFFLEGFNCTRLQKLAIHLYFNDKFDEIPFADTFPSLEDFQMECDDKRKPLDLKFLKAPKLKRINVASKTPVKHFSSERYPELEFFNCISEGVDLKHCAGFKKLKDASFWVPKMDDLSVIGHWKNLRSLSIKLKELPSNIPSWNLKNLKRLTLYISGLRTTENLENLTNLESLKLISNVLSNLNGLDNMVNLKILEASFSDITKIDCDFSKLVNLQDLNLRINQISSFENISSFPKLRFLDLSKNNLQSIDQALNYPSLENLNLSFNSLQKLENFEALTSLKKFDAMNNQIAEINSTFTNFNQLEKLDLSWNSIKSMKAFQSVSNLKILNLARNKISRVDVDELDLPRLERLDLSGNELTMIGNLKLPALRELNLACNRITKIETNLKLPALRELTLAYNRITKIETNLSELLNLEKLHLCNNKIKSFKNINAIPNLLILNLFNNELESIDLPLDFPRLLNFHLGRNSLTSWNIESQNLPSLENLDLSENKFVSLEQIAEACTIPGLKNLDIGKNNIPGLTKLSQMSYVEDSDEAKQCSNNNIVSFFEMMLKVNPKLFIRHDKGINNNFYPQEKNPRENFTGAHDGTNYLQFL
ncbi:hypothetical protein DASC09_053020 [Saccharomycopsis crataegensis]|uniref:L domain-like protein n=1 Tax=Saccharomycopsis crataegensis TaxID=43959 RepID=A0AAV5QSX5_9ASCO|nr:hypothetical protein DASC09_053020 [Saccharomycopsis crataegensis]